VYKRQRLAAPVTLAACGWRPAARDGEVSGAQHPWLISALAEEERARWLKALSARKIALDGIAPAWGLGPPAQPPEGDESSLVLERHARAVLVKRVSARGTESVRLAVFDEDAEAEARVLSRMLDGPHAEDVVAYGFSPQAEALIGASVPQARFGGPWETAALEALASNALGAVPEGPPLVDPRDPAPPIYKNPDFYRGVMAAGVLLAVVAWDGWHRVQLWRLDARFQKLEQEYEEKRVIAQAVQRQRGAATSLQTRLAQTEEDLEAARAEQEIASYLLERRPQLTTGLLDAVRAAAAGDVVVSAVREAAEPRESFVVSAWALREIAAERFVSALNSQLGPLSLSVADESLERGIGVRGMRGFTVKLRVAPSPRNGPVTPDTDGAPALEPSVPTSPDAPANPARKAEMVLR